MSKTDIYDTILNLSSKLIEKEGFKILKKDSCLSRKTAMGNDKICFAVYDNFNQYRLGTVFTKRIEEVEKIFHLFSMIDKKYQNQSWTISFPLYFFDKAVESVNFKFAVNSLYDLHAISEHLASICHNEIIPLFDELEDGHKLHNLMWSLIDRNSTFGDLEGNYAQGLILSHLYAPQYLADHIAFVENKLPNFNPLSQSRLTNLINYLKA